MEISKVSAELQSAVRKLPPMPLASWWGRRLIQALLGMVPAAHVEGVKLRRVDDAGAGLRIHVPDVRRSAGALLWIHGGGFLIGRPKQDDLFCAMTAKLVDIPVIAAGYRLAPRFPFPAALDDCYTAWLWLQENAASLGVDPHSVIIGDQSAGGALAASLVQRVCDAGGIGAKAQWLFCPALDDRTAARRELDGLEHFVWANRNNAFGWRSYVSTEPGTPIIPPYAAAARREDMHGLPAAWIGVGEIDLFHDEDLDYARRLREADVAVTMVTVPGAPHGFEAWAPKTEIACNFISGARQWLMETVQG
ncbi:alpha/beta hydrolase [Acidocella aquatica]|nr:alpha/beta hydrolase [Acidocella aquatica]